MPILPALLAASQLAALPAPASHVCSAVHAADGLAGRIVPWGRRGLDRA
jgi:hypothetical protein